MWKGFTLIELLIVVVIIGILTSIAIPNFVRINEKARDASVLANMHTIQVTVELFRIDFNRYPSSVSEISLPPNFKNPYNPSQPGLQDESSPDIRGVVEYKTNEECNFYWITGINGKLKVMDLVLTPGK